MKYTVKPEVVEAVLYTGENREELEALAEKSVTPLAINNESEAGIMVNRHALLPGEYLVLRGDKHLDIWQAEDVAELLEPAA